MKRSFLLIAFCATLAPASWNCFGQTPIRIGITGGVNLAKQSLSSEFDKSYFCKSKDMRIGLIAGGVADLNITKTFSVQVEARYIQKGMKWLSFEEKADIDPMPYVYDRTDELAYLEIPVLLKAGFAANFFKPFVFFGPNFGILISAETHGVLLIPGIGPQEERGNARDGYQPLDISLDIGAGAEYQPSRNIAVFGSARYSFGMYDINLGIFSRTFTIRSTGIQFMTGALLNL